MGKRDTLIQFITLNRDENAEAPLFRQIYLEMRNAILTGKIRTGARLPSSRELAIDLGISRNTILAAYAQLIAEGYIESIGGSGTFVAGVLPEEMLQSRPSSPPPENNHSQRRLLSTRGKTLEAVSPDIGEQAFGKLLPFRSSTPDPLSFPFSVWSRLLNRHSRTPSSDLLGYNYPAGYPRLREVIADYLNSTRGVRCDASQIIIVSGAITAFEIIVQMLLDPGDTVLIEDPGYFGIRGVCLRASVKISPIPIDDEGASITAVRKNKKAKLLYITPSHQYPLGVTMSLNRRLELLEWARQNKTWIIEDDYDGELRYSGRPIPSLQGLDKDGLVIYCGTFSKVMFPSLRVSYFVAPPGMAPPLIKGRILTDMHSSTIIQATLADFIEDGHFLRHLRRMRKLYAERQSYLIDCVNTELKGKLEIEKSDAGMHLIGWLPPNIDDKEVAQAAWDHGVVVDALSSLALRPLRRKGLVLGYTAFNKKIICAGIRHLRMALTN